MTTLKQALDYRRHIKSRKPDFIRQDAHKRPALGKKWRRPRGIQSKMRKHLHGYRRSVDTGYRSPVAIRGFHRSGLQGVLVMTLSELNSIDTKTQGAIIAHVGMKRKLELLRQAQAKKIPILNVKDAAAFLKKAEDAIKTGKEAKASKQQKKQAKVEEIKKQSKAKEAEKQEDTTEEEKRKEQVKEMEKVLTKKQ